MTQSNNIVNDLLEKIIVNVHNKEVKKLLVCMKDEEYYCNICNLRVFPEAVVEQHVSGKKHRKYVLFVVVLKPSLSTH